MNPNTGEIVDLSQYSDKEIKEMMHPNGDFKRVPDSHVEEARRLLQGRKSINIYNESPDSRLAKLCKSWKAAKMSQKEFKKRKKAFKLVNGMVTKDELSNAKG